jgi:glycosyltransferase involved in cell wall biosynthesis
VRIQLLSLNFEPEQTGIAPYSTALARHLSAEHDVTVLTGVAHYPDWRIPAEAKRWRRDDRDGNLRIIRLRHFVPNRPSVAGRLAYELSWAGRAALAGRSIPADAVIAVVPALLGAHAARLIARRHRAPLGVLVQDVMSAAAAQSGVRGGGIVSQATSRIEHSALSAADSITTIHPRLAVELARVAHDGKQPRVIYNWTHFPSRPLRDPGLRRRYGWRDDEVIALHSGNMGSKQYLEVVVDAARLAQRAGHAVRFVLAGGGSRRHALEAYAHGCDRVGFLDLVPDEEYMSLLSAADVLLVNERPGMREMSLPSKLTSYLAAGRPIVAATDASGATAEFIRASGGGLITPGGEPVLLLDAVVRVASDHALATQLTDCGQRFADEALSEAVALSSYEGWVGDLASAGTRHRVATTAMSR